MSTQVLFTLYRIASESYTRQQAIEKLHKRLERMLEESVLRYTKDIPAWLSTTEQFLKVSAVKRETLSPAHASHWSDALVENLREYFGEEHGNEDGDDLLADDDLDTLHTKMREVTSFYLCKVKVYPCEHLRDFTLDSADILELVQQLRPEWLTKENP